MTINALRTYIFGLMLAVAELSICSIAYAQSQPNRLVPDTGQRTTTVRTTTVVPNDDQLSSKKDLGVEKFTTIGENVVANSPQFESRPSLTRTLFPAVKKPAKQTAGDAGWHFAFAPYLYATGLSGTVGARGRTATVDLSFGDVLKHFDIGIMGTLEARKNRFVTLNDFLWMKLSEKRDTPGGLFTTAKIGVNMFLWNPAAGYRIYENKAGSFDVLGGMRLMSIETNLNFTSGIATGFDVSQRKTWAAPTIGGRGVANLSPKFFLSTIFDIGGGFGTHVTGQFYGGAGYRITRKIALIGGYRYMKNDYSDNNGFLFNTSMNGLLFGAKFDF